MTTTKPAGTGRQGRTKDLRDIRQRGRTYQVRVFVGRDPATGQQHFLTGTAASEKEAIKLRDRYRAEVAAGKAANTRATLAHLLREWLSTHTADENTVSGYRLYAEKFVIPALGDAPLATLSRSGGRDFERLYADLRRCRRRCNGKPFVEHRSGCAPDDDGNRHCDKRCRPHVCKPLGESSLRQMHTVCNGALKAAIRWGWLGVNPLDATVRPRAPRPKPNPPTADEAALIIEKAMDLDADWGAFVWLTMVTGARRSELVALRWSDLRLHCSSCGHGLTPESEKCPNEECGAKLADGWRVGTLEIRRGYVRRSGRVKEADTKSHQMRRIALDASTVDILLSRWLAYNQRAEALNWTSNTDAYMFSYALDHRKPYSPDGVSHKYSRMAAEIGLKTHIHELRHYSATELLAAGVDLRTVAGRLGHAGGGTTTLRVYAAWVRSADEQAAAMLAARLPRARSKRNPD